MRVAHAELADDVVLHFLCRGRGERENRRAAESLCDRAEAQIVGTEIVSPLADAVRFIDDEESDVCGARSRSKKSRSLNRSGVR